MRDSKDRERRKSAALVLGISGIAAGACIGPTVSPDNLVQPRRRQVVVSRTAVDPFLLESVGFSAPDRVRLRFSAPLLPAIVPDPSQFRLSFAWADGDPGNPETYATYYAEIPYEELGWIADRVEPDQTYEVPVGVPDVVGVRIPEGRSDEMELQLSRPVYADFFDAYCRDPEVGSCAETGIGGQCGAGVYLHYDLQFATPVASAEGQVLAPIGAAWVVARPWESTSAGNFVAYTEDDIQIARVPGYFPLRPGPVPLRCDSGDE